MQVSMVSKTRTYLARPLFQFGCAAVLLAATLSPSLAQVGKPWAWGYNYTGELGDGTGISKHVPTAVKGLSKVIRVAGGGGHSLFLKSDGTVWAAGENKRGQLGNGAGGDGTSNFDQVSPVQVVGITNAVQITAASEHSVALLADGTVRAWGVNYSGELGDGTGNNANHTSDKNVPVVVSGLNHIVQISAGRDNTLALRSDGTVWAWGYNGNGQIGNGTGVSKSVPVQTLKLTNIVQVAGSQSHSMALGADGTVWVWGYNGTGAFGDGTFKSSNTPVVVPNFSGVVQLAGGGAHTLALKSDGSVWSWGANDRGQLGDGLGGDNTNAHDTNLPNQVMGLPKVAQVAIGAAHSLVLTPDGTIFAWGFDEEGQLGDNGDSIKSTPQIVPGLSGQTFIAAGALHSLSVQVVAQKTKLSASNLTLQYGMPINPSAVLRDGVTKMPLISESLAFNVNGVDLGAAKTDASGRAVTTFPNALDATTGVPYPITVSFAGDMLFQASRATATLTITKADTKIGVANVAGKIGETKFLTATLRRKFDNAPIAGIALSFKLDAHAEGSAVTDGTGKASFAYFIDGTRAPGLHTITAEFFNDANYNAASANGSLVINQAPTKTSASAVSGKRGKVVVLKAKLIRNTDKMGLVGKPLHFMIDGTEVGVGETDNTGLASLNYTIPMDATVGGHPIKVVYDGETNYIGSSDDSKTLTVK